MTNLSHGAMEVATLDISVKKTKAMPIRQCERPGASTETDIEKLTFKFKCTKCDRPFHTEKGMKIHATRWYRPDGPQRSRLESLAYKAVKLAKRKEEASRQLKVSISGQELENVLHFEYLGCRVAGDGDETADNTVSTLPKNALHLLIICGRTND